MMWSNDSVKADARNAGYDSHVQYGMRQGWRRCNYCNQWGQKGKEVKTGKGGKEICNNCAEQMKAQRGA